MTIPIIFPFLIFVLALWLVFLALPQPEEVSLGGQYGTIDLTDVDFTNDIVFITHIDWESYIEALYTPDDFAAGVSAEPRAFDMEDYRRNEYATHRMLLRLPPGKSSDYAMRFYINGELVDTVGNPSVNEETNIPRVAERMY